MKIKILFVMLLLAGAIVVFWRHQASAPALASAEDTASAAVKQTAKQAAEKVVSAKPAAPGACGASKPAKAVIVSLSRQHMWACAGAQQVYETAVTTGATAYDDGTPTGTWAVYAKQTDTYLKGSDDRGSWNDHVDYWMPFFGAYGFHDSSWQTFAYGDLTKYTTQGSHGCVHLPLSAMKWLYGWAPVGTPVTVES